MREFSERLVPETLDVKNRVDSMADVSQSCIDGLHRLYRLEQSESHPKQCCGTLCSKS